MLDTATFKGYWRIIESESCKSSYGCGFKLSFGTASRGNAHDICSFISTHTLLLVMLFIHRLSNFHGKFSGRTSTRPFMRAAYPNTSLTLPSSIFVIGILSPAAGPGGAAPDGTEKFPRVAGGGCSLGCEIGSILLFIIWNCRISMCQDDELGLLGGSVGGGGGGTPWGYPCSWYYRTIQDSEGIKTLLPHLFKLI